MWRGERPGEASYVAARPMANSRAPLPLRRTCWSFSLEIIEDPMGMASDARGTVLDGTATSAHANREGCALVLLDAPTCVLAFYLDLDKSMFIRGSIDFLWAECHESILRVS